MNKRQYDAIKKMLDICWEIRRANQEGGDILAGQFLDKEFDDAVDNASRALGKMVIDRDDPVVVPDSLKDLLKK